MESTGNVLNQSLTILRDNPFSNARQKTKEQVEDYVGRKLQEMLDRTRVLDERAFMAFQNEYLIDERTGLVNKAAFDRKLEYEALRAKRYRRFLSIMFLSMDNLDIAVRQYGTLILDDLYLQFADHLRANLRDTDIIGRMGVNLFGVICPETDLEGTLTIARRIGSSMRSKPFLPRLGETITASVGMSALPFDGNTLEQLRDKAELHLAMAIEAQGNCVFFTAEVGDIDLRNVAEIGASIIL